MASNWFWWVSAEHLTIDRIILILIALPGGIVSLRALYKLYRYGGQRIWDVIENFFKNEVGEIIKKRKPVLDHIRKSPALPREDAVFVDVHGTIDEAIKLFAKGRPKDKLQAEAVLTELVDRLDAKARLAAQRVELAREQAAAVLLFSGSIAESREDHKTALVRFDKVLQLVPDDPDATKFIGLLRPSEAITRFEKLLDIGIKKSDLALQAEALRLKANALRDLNSDGLASTALESAVELEERRPEKDFAALALTYRKWAEVSEKLHGRKGVPWKAIERFEKAEENYRLARDEAAAKQMRDEADRLQPPGASAPPPAGP
jgi:tetratricopeptide (TPR) repeat protein